MFEKNIFDQLKKEHKEVKSLLEKAESCSESDRKDLLEKIEENLVPHARGEEKTLYARMRQEAKKQSKEDSLDLTNEAYEEHRVADELLAELQELSPSDEKWLAHLKVFKENIEHHIKEEEDELFDKAKNLLSSEDEEDILDNYMSEKERFSESLPQQSQIQERSPAQSSRSY